MMKHTEKICYLSRQKQSNIYIYIMYRVPAAGGGFDVGGVGVVADFDDKHSIVSQIATKRNELI